MHSSINILRKYTSAHTVSVSSYAFIVLRVVLKIDSLHFYAYDKPPPLHTLTDSGVVLKIHSPICILWNCPSARPTSLSPPHAFIAYNVTARGEIEIFVRGEHFFNRICTDYTSNAGFYLSTVTSDSGYFQICTFRNFGPTCRTPLIPFQDSFRTLTAKHVPAQRDNQVSARWKYFCARRHANWAGDASLRFAGMPSRCW